MSKKPCRACGQMVPTSSPNCPRCRVEGPTHSWLRRNLGLIGLGVAVSVAAVVLLRGGSTDEEATPAAPSTRVYHVGDSTEVRMGPGPENPLAYVAEPGALIHVYEAAGDSAEWLALSSGEAATDTVGFVRRDLARLGLPPALLVIRHDTTRREGNKYVVGLARNTTDSTFSYAFIQLIELRQGQMLGVGGIASINNLGPHDYWEWHALLSADSADTYEIFDVHTETAPPARP